MRQICSSDVGKISTNQITFFITSVTVFQYYLKCNSESRRKVDDMPILLYCLSKLENEFIMEELRFGYVGNRKEDGFFTTTFIF